ncbi:hypothetical protein [Lentzea sp. HUAS12]|uniref:phage shock envelope stress response protein PspM n=1 Tax=Lentzea sp. HUAS12 TaxID=2951806 RepID=UPI00209C833A|nr:hypothetical protein [Lentzea sp. HUAS12]USX51661.1 hypothetical protein ND450_41025 [Lentzea sp. HUAS12]
MEPWRNRPNNEIVRKVVGELGASLQGHPLAEQARYRLQKWNDPVAKLERKRKRTNAVLTFWLIVISMLGTLAVLGFTGVLGTWAAVTGSIGAAVPAVLAVRSGFKLKELGVARQRLALSPPPRPRPPLPAHISSARVPMEKLHSAEDAMAQLLVQLDSPALTSMPTESVQHARQTAQEAATAIRAVSAQLQAVERARDNAPPLERAPLVEGVRVLRIQLADGVDRYCALVAEAGKALAASTQFQNPGEVLDDATDHMAGLASAMRDVSGYSAH